MSMPDAFSRTPSLRAPSHNSVKPDDAPQRPNGAPPNDESSDINAKPRGLPRPPSKPQVLSDISPSAAVPLARAGTLSWQQRPSSRGSTGSRSRPLSMIASENNAARSPRASAVPLTGNDESMSKSQIAQSLGSRDPSWFRQTQDRGSGSAAFRKNQVEDTPEPISSTGLMRLPGMSRENTVEPEGSTSPPPASVRSDSIFGNGSLQGIFKGPNISDSGSTSSNSIRSPLPTMSSQRFEPPSSDSTSTSGADDSFSIGRTLAMSPSQGRISPERMDRPASPTKGLGGFVQSAMLKRSDSVNKRWSTQGGPGLSRGNSIASNMSGYGGSRYPTGGITPLAESRPSSISREGSPRPNSRPTSSHSSATVTGKDGEDSRPGTSTSLTSSVPGSRFDEILPVSNSRKSYSPAPVVEMMSPPASPSKKWSPTKSSWLENALNKPDSPKVKSPAPQQPAWMPELSRAKQQRGSVDLGRGGSNFKEVSIGGLVRSPPPGAGYRPPTIGGLPSGFSAGIATKSRSGSVDDTAQSSASTNVQKPKDTSLTESTKETPPQDTPSSPKTVLKAKPDIPAASKPTVPLIGAKTSARLAVRTVSPTATKTKPDTPPKRDFKSPLKPRQVSEENKSKEEPEFKNVFGNLKRTQTKNYVAPDELKDTILRGKTGLAQTGGPKKTERKDELKESLLQKKQGMVLPTASTRITSASSKFPDQSTPEAIAKRRGLTRSESSQSNGNGEEERQAPKPEALAKLAHLRDKPRSASPEKQPSAQTTVQKELGPNAGLGGNFVNSLASVLQRGPSPAGKPAMTESSKKEPEGRVSEKAREPVVPLVGPQLTHATKARARGPKRRLPTASKQETSTSPPKIEAETQPESHGKDPVKEGKPPIEIRSPKPHASPLSPNKPEPRPLSNITHNNNNNRKPSQPLSPRKPSTTISPPSEVKKASPIDQVANRELQAKTSPLIKQKPVMSPQDPQIRRPSTSTPTVVATTPLRRPQAQEPQSNGSAGQERNGAEAKDEDLPLPSVKGAAASWGQSTKPSHTGRARSPVKLPTRKNEEAAMEEAGLKAKEHVGPAIKTPTKEPQQPTERIPQSPKSPPLPGKKPASIAARFASATLPPPVTAPKPSSVIQTSHVGRLFADVFDEPPNSKSKASIDTEAVLESRSSIDSSQKIKTLRKQIFEISEDWKTVRVASQEEHILFEESLYLCTHVFGTLAGQRTTEVYLWCGDSVPFATVEEAHLFAKKFAKDNNGKLVILKQGKETTNFFQALGGIVITRRGAFSRADMSAGSGATYMLCGRQHVGQIAFDEVDFNPRSLCKGFPYIISAGGGKLYLWKGSGSGADELGCARLIGMDLGLAGEIEEVDEGREPDAFWECFPGEKRNMFDGLTVNVEYWHLKPSCEKYTNRLFNVGTPRPKSSSGTIQGAMQWVRRGSAPASDSNASSTAQIREVMPFAQSDLSDDGVFVLDTFFEIFVYVQVIPC